MLKNPWRSISKVNPQRENGNRQISTEVLLALIAANLSAIEYKLCFFIIHKTWGFNKRSDAIPLRQFFEALNVSERAIWDNLRKLKAKKIIFSAPSKRVHRGSPLNEYLFNKHYDTWFTGQLKELVDKCLKSGDNSVDNL